MTIGKIDKLLDTLEDKLEKNYKINEEKKNIVSNFVRSKTKLSSEALVEMVVFLNRTDKVISEDVKQALFFFGYIDKDLNITESGTKFLNSTETIERLKLLIS